ncbi:MAG: 3-keto-5-aminohexanoate cleavage protein [Proteobacteria bacterium]|nr:3-keto-5-aminohexanoate cleavage protein [Pseudomonadota bacterium]NDC23445.1 3-keto-5-aminohexanoate cleavage protein [Pseudomonadota bacterium]NDD04349.1 3-keto-5-aminohexanoate cleavage protein [Pseudomonadota bacterium]NDG26672.1 3-keto-5-aminohexanoate cleavage protein [Pseudomonadota bacterium]
MEKLIITAAITGAEVDKTKCPVLPITPEEQALAAKEAVEAGASVIHLHVRDKTGRPSQESSDFKAAVDAIRKACKGNEPIIQFSTGGAVGEKIEKRIAPLTLKPEMASFNLGTINFGDEIFVNTFPDMRKLAAAFKDENVIPEYEVYDVGHLDNLKKLIREGIIKSPYHCQFVLGVPGALSGSISTLNFLVANLPENSHWAVAGIGKVELPLAVHAILMGGHVRVGLEDNIYYSKGIAAKSNAQLVERIVRIANEVERPIATIADARKLLLGK